MARGKGVPPGGNKFMRMIKNHELVGKGERQTREQILEKGPNNPKKVIADIIAKKEGTNKDR